MHFHLDPLLNKPIGDHSIAAGGQHCFSIQPFFWPTLLTLFPYPDTSEETNPQGTDLLGC